MSDAELVREVQNGTMSSYGVLVGRWSARLIGYVYARTSDRDAAEDIAQDCLLKAFRSLGSLNDPEKFGGWLMSIAFRATVDWQRAKARREISYGPSMNGHRNDPGFAAPSRDQPSERCERREEETQLFEAIAALPEKLRETLLIYYYSDVTYQQIADMLGVSSATINARLTKARNQLRRCLDSKQSDTRSAP